MARARFWRGIWLRRAVVALLLLLAAAMTGLGLRAMLGPLIQREAGLGPDVGQKQQFRLERGLERGRERGLERGLGGEDVVPVRAAAVSVQTGRRVFDAGPNLAPLPVSRDGVRALLLGEAARTAERARLNAGLAEAEALEAALARQVAELDAAERRMAAGFVADGAAGDAAVLDDVVPDTNTVPVGSDRAGP